MQIYLNVNSVKTEIEKIKILNKIIALEENISEIEKIQELNTSSIRGNVKTSKLLRKSLFNKITKKLISTVNDDVEVFNNSNQKINQGKMVGDVRLFKNSLYITVITEYGNDKKLNCKIINCN